MILKKIKIFYFEHKAISLILLFSLILRLFWIYFVRTEPVNDAMNYFNLANSIATYHYFGINDISTTHFMPGYPAFIASIFFLVGSNPEWIYFIQVIVSVLTNVLVYRISLQLHKDKKIALIAAFIFAIYLNVISYCSVLISETFFTFLFLFVIFLIQKVVLNPVNKINYALIASFGGIAIFTKPQIIIFFIFAFLYLFFTKKVSFKRILPLSLIALLPLIWILRNHKLSGSFIIASNGMENLYIGNNSNATGYYMIPDKCTEIENKIEQAKCYKSEVIQFFKSPNQNLFSLGLKKMRAQYRYETDGINWNEMALPQYNWSTLKSLCQINYLVILFFCGVTILLHLTSKIKIDFIIYAAILTFIIIGLVYFGDSRFHFPSIPAFCILSSFSINYFLCKLRAKWKIYNKL